jgi:hypothetical protein
MLLFTWVVQFWLKLGLLTRTWWRCKDASKLIIIVQIHKLNRENVCFFF